MGWRTRRNRPPVRSLPWGTGVGSAVSERPRHTAPRISTAVPAGPVHRAAVASHAGSTQASPGGSSRIAASRASWITTKHQAIAVSRGVSPPRAGSPGTTHRSGEMCVDPGRSWTVRCAGPVFWAAATPAGRVPARGARSLGSLGSAQDASSGRRRWTRWTTTPTPTATIQPAVSSAKIEDTAMPAIAAARSVRDAGHIIIVRRSRAGRAPSPLAFQDRASDGGHVERSGATCARMSSASSAMKSGSSGLAVDDLERPSPDEQLPIGSAELSAQFDEVAEADVGERAGDVGEHLDGAHVPLVERRPSHARLGRPVLAVAPRAAQAHRSLAGTPPSTCSTCWPHPA